MLRETRMKQVNSYYLKQHLRPAIAISAAFAAIFIVLFAFCDNRLVGSKVATQASIQVHQRTVLDTKLGTRCSIEFELFNPNAFSVEIVGCKPSCSCVTPLKYPRNLQANSKEIFTVEFHAKTEGNVGQHISLYFSGQQLEVVDVDLSGKVL